MIAELFYPKELKELIADLRAKDDLKAGYKKYIFSESIIFSFVIITGASIISFLEQGGSTYLLLLATIFALFMVRVQVSRIFRNFVKPYTMGRCILGKITQSNFEKYYPSTSGYWIMYEFVVCGITYKGKSEPIKRPLANMTFEEGDDICVYYIENDPSINAPHTEIWNENYCLSKSRQIS